MEDGGIMAEFSIQFEYKTLTLPIERTLEIVLVKIRNDASVRGLSLIKLTSD